MPFEVSSAQCAERGATLPVIHTDAESVFIQERIKRPIWINLERFPPRSNMWQWADGSMTNVTKWYPGQPQNTPNHNCAVADNRGAMTGWRVEHCSAYREILCEKGICLSYYFDLGVFQKLFQRMKVTSSFIGVRDHYQDFKQNLAADTAD